MSRGVNNEHEEPPLYYFGARSHEYNAVYKKNVQALHHFNQFNILPSNFGTIDNPALIFSNGIPYKYVACVGHYDEH